MSRHQSDPLRVRADESETRSIIKGLILPPRKWALEAEAGTKFSMYPDLS